MENLTPSDGDPRHFQATQQFWTRRDHPSAAAGGGHWQADGLQADGLRADGLRADGGLPSHLRRDRRKALRWTVGIGAAVVLGAGSVLAGTALTAPSAPAASAAPAAGPSGSAALLRATLSGANSPYGVAYGLTSAGAAGAGAGLPAGANQSAFGGGAGPGVAPGAGARACDALRRAAKAARLAGRPRVSGAARAAARRCHLGARRIVRFFLLNGVDGQFTFQTRHGMRTLAYERGVVESIAPGSSVVVKAADGTVWTWDLVSSTVVRDHGGKVAQSSLAQGETVWVGGPVKNGAKDARLVVINPPTRPAGQAGQPGAPAASPSASPSGPSAAGG